MDQETTPTTTPVEIRKGNDVLSVDPMGGKITLSLDGIPILGSFTRGDGKNGTSHPCTPIFGPEIGTEFGIKQHGDMRNTLCEVKEIEDGISIRHDIKDAPGKYPDGMMVDQQLSLDGGVFTLTTTHTNSGSEAAPVNYGEHFYFHAPKSYEGTRINGVDVSELIETTGVFRLQDGENSIEIPNQPIITMKQKGMSFVTLWTYKDQEQGTYDQNYVCIEPIEGNPNDGFFGSEESMIVPGSSRTNSVSLSIRR